MIRFAAVAIFAASLTACAPEAPHSYQVFFDPKASTLDAVAQETVGHAAQAAMNHPMAVVTVNGYAAPLGSRKVELDVAAARAKAVADALAADGVPAARIQHAGHGASPDADPGIESRRVEITVTGF
jgi:outer membrane protein OmpA-like peptidoglycan-associated protein